MRFLPQIPALAAVIAIAAIACASSDGATMPVVPPTSAAENDLTSATGELPPNGVSQIQILSGPKPMLDKRLRAYRQGMDLYVPNYIPAGFQIIAHQINAYEFDIGTSFAARPGSGSEVAVLQSAMERKLPPGRSVDINGVPGVMTGGEGSGRLDVYFNRDGNHFIVASYRSIQCGESCADFSEAITLAVARSLHPLPLDPAVDFPPGFLEPLILPNGIQNAFPEINDRFLRQLEIATRERGVRLYIPTYVPENFRISPIYGIGGAENALAFVDTRTSNMVTIFQTPWVQPGSVTAPEIAIGDNLGTVVGSGSSGHLEIRFVLNSIRFEVIGHRSSSCSGLCLEFSTDLFVRIAESMRPAVLDVEGIPRPAGFLKPAP